MTEKWRAEIDVDDRLARELIESQWPPLAGAAMRRFGEGWDNSVYLVGERLVFRFPRRTIAVPLIEHEIAMLPKLAPRLPVPIPVPAYAGVPSPSYPWPFQGYDLVPGDPACSRDLSDGEREQLASDLGRFLHALRAIDVTPLAGLRADSFGKLRPELIGLDEPPLQAEDRVVHGDLYARHILLDGQNRLCDRARHHASYVLEYAASVGDARLKRAAEIALAFSGS